MKTTLDISSDLYRQVKVKAASEGRKIRDLVTDGLVLVLRGATVSDDKQTPSTAFDVMRDACGCTASGLPDLATHPRHMEGFGRA
jgi:hypothetical protein